MLLTHVMSLVIGHLSACPCMLKDLVDLNQPQMAAALTASAADEHQMGQVVPGRHEWRQPRLEVSPCQRPSYVPGKWLNLERCGDV